MRHDLKLEGLAYRLRPVTDDDASMIVELRNDPVSARYIHPGASDIPEQLAWLRTYYDRPGDRYFAVERMGADSPEGFVGLYDGTDEEAEFGRWILARGSLAAAESALLVYRAAFDVLRLRRVYTRTVTSNKAVVALHDRYGARRTGRMIEFQLGQDVLPATEHEVTVGQWPDAEATLEGFASLAARALLR